jgi:hypothetical protein
MEVFPPRRDDVASYPFARTGRWNSIPPTVATEGTVTPVEGVVGLHGKLTPACLSLPQHLAPGTVSVRGLAGP